MVVRPDRFQRPTMRLPLFALAALLLALPASAEQVTVGGTTRSYELHRPIKISAGNSGQAMPLMIVLHESGGTAARIRRSLNMDVIANREGFAIAYPEALGGGWNDGRFGPARSQGAQSIDDVAFIKTLANQLAARGLGGLGEAAVVGIDGGGMMVYRLACETSGVFSSYAALLANMPTELTQRCASTPTPMMILAATEDSIMPFAGGRLTGLGMVQSADQTFQFWGQANRCRPGDVGAMPDLDNRDGSRIEVLTTTNCARGADTVFFRVTGSGHQLPTRPAASRPVDKAAGRINHDADAADLIWMFASGRR